MHAEFRLNDTISDLAGKISSFGSMPPTVRRLTLSAAHARAATPDNVEAFRAAVAHLPPLAAQSLIDFLNHLKAWE